MFNQKKELRTKEQQIQTAPIISQQIPMSYIMGSYQGGYRYSLKDINSILFKDGKIYNLLEKNTVTRVIKCGCVKSSCEAKYCQCYRWGQACTEECSCYGCRNKEHKSKNKKYGDVGCNCVKSGCTKKYCQCFQNGNKCTPNCKCANCRNME